VAFQTSRGQAVIIAKEILRSAAGLDDIKSMVLDSTYVLENPSTTGRYLVEAGTVLSLGPSDGKVKPVYEGENVVQANVAGILGHTVEFWLGPGIDASTNTDKPVPVLHHGCDFDIAKLVGYAGNETDVKAALPTCLFR